MRSTMQDMTDRKSLALPPRGFTARPAAMDDLPAAVELHELNERAVLGHTTGFARRFEMFWTSPDCTVGEDIRIVQSPEGKIVGCIKVIAQPPHVQARMIGDVHPDLCERGIGSYLVRWAEGRARQITGQAPEGTRLTLQTWVPAADERTAALMSRHGLTVQRHFVFMRIDFGGPPEAPRWPEGVEVRPVTLAEHGRAISAADEEIFRDHWGFAPKTDEEAYERFRHWVEHDPDLDESLWFVAFAGDEIAGVSLCWPKAEEDPSVGYIGILGVRRRWRGKGLGLALLRHSFVEFHKRGRRAAALHADAENITGALRLYTKAGMHIARQYKHFQKELRPGRELATMALQE
jgi:mycothiol synthase